MRRKFTIMLESRDSAEVEKQWDAIDVSYEDIMAIADIVARQCRWPNRLFVPDDAASVVLWEDIEMSPVHTICEIERAFKTGDLTDIYEHVPRYTFGDFVLQVVGQRGQEL